MEGAADGRDVPGREGAVEVERLGAADVLQRGGEAVKAGPFAVEAVVFAEDEVETAVAGGADGVTFVRAAVGLVEAAVYLAVKDENGARLERPLRVVRD